tara:strand:- start:1497 stop:2459 length:963 start_codon:yes stop_codon:yes gene_type:complete
MKYFTLGKHKLSKYCLGTWSLGGEKENNFSYGNVSTLKAQKILKYAYKNGINFFDTANVYGDAEIRLGKCFAKIRKKIFIANKIGCTSFDKKIDLSLENVNNQISNSLENLKTNYLDLVQLYNPNPGDENLRACLNFLNEKKEAGVIRYIGVSLREPKDYLLLRKLYRFDTVQCNFNILDHRVFDSNILKLIKKDKSKLLARTVLNFGIFTEEFISKREIIFNKNDHRHKWNLKQIKLWKKYANQIKDLSNRKIENTCYKFCNSFNVSSIIIGATNNEHIASAIILKNYIKLNNEEVLKIKKIYNKFSNNYFAKPKYKIR